ncbi:MAG: HEAT repeat domain-containing protein [Planctomycetales bacterium]
MSAALLLLSAIHLADASAPSDFDQLLRDFAVLQSGGCGFPSDRETVREGDAAWSALKTRHAQTVFLRDLAAKVSATDDDPGQLLAIDLLGRFGGETDGVVEVLVGRLESPNEAIQLAAIEALAALGSSAKSAGPRIARLLSDRNFPPRLRDAAIGPGGAFERIDADFEVVAPLLIALLDAPDKAANFFAIWHIAHAPSSWHENGALAKRLERHLVSDEVGIDAAMAAWRVGGDREAIVATLRDRLSSDEPSVRRAAASYLGEIGPPARAAIPALERLLADRSSRSNAVRSLWKITGKTEIAVEQLRESLRDEKLDIVAASVLADLGPSAKNATPELTAMLRSGSESNRVAAADALGRIGKPAKSAVPELIVRFETDLGSARGAAAKALQRIDAEDPVVRAAIERHIRSARKNSILYCTPFNRCWADFVWIARLHGRGPIMAPMLSEKLSQDVELDERLQLIRLIGLLGEDGKVAVPVLIRQLRHDSAYVRQATAETMGQIGAGARDALPILRELRNDASRFVRWQAEDAILRIDSQ